MNSLGINGTGDGEITPESLRAIGSAWVRVVLLERFDLNGYIDRCHAQGLKVLGTIAKESLGIQPSGERWSMQAWLNSLGQAHTLTESPPESLSGTMSFSEAARFYADRYGDKLDALQVGNESDHESPSSWTMSHDDLNNLLFAFDQEFPRTRIVGPGLVSGDPIWARGIDLQLVDAIACHTYCQAPNRTENWDELPGNFGDVNDLLDRYRAETDGLPLWVTEVGVSTTEVTWAFQARYCGSMMHALKARTDVDVAFWFCMGDWMVPEFGLYDASGRPKSSATTFHSAAGDLPAPEPVPPPPPPPPEKIVMPDSIYYDLWNGNGNADWNPARGFERYWRDHMAELGATVSPKERPGENGSTFRAFEHGVLRWTSEHGVEVVKP